ncbi:TPA: ParA family protein [Burkholderia vietnamiensis]|nr:ParA family protein [Burkholderia vietnamiensis]
MAAKKPQSQAGMVSLSMFNNKGGVGKTTLTCNLASLLSTKYNKRVLVVDCDPQCNSTQLIMGETYATSLYWDHADTNGVTTVKEILQKIEDGDSDINENVVPVKSSENRFQVDLIPGHPALSIVEDRLGAAWHSLKGGDLGGIRQTNWSTALCRVIQRRYDIVFFDLGPSLGALNRSILIGCDRFVTPMGTDIFSILGVRNIGEWLKSWTGLYENALKLCEKATPNRLKNYPISTSLSIQRGFSGYTLQQYITKSKQGIRRPTKAYEEIINNVPAEVEKSLGNFWGSINEFSNAKLGDIPHLYSLIPLAQTVSAPIMSLKSQDGLVGSQFQQRDEYVLILSRLADNLMSNINNPLAE